MSKIEELQKRYMALAHAVQSGIATLMERPYPKFITPKHLRVGIDTSKADFGALTRLLITKGVITEEELWEALADGMQREVNEYQERCEKELGVKVTLL